MKKILLFLLLSFPLISTAQVFWTETFTNNCASDCFANTYSGPNGAWTQTITGAEGIDPNEWYVSCAENGFTAGNCGAACTSGGGATGASLHVGSSQNWFADQGASYDAGGFCGILSCPLTNKRIESPVINCTGRSNITLSFTYIEEGAPPQDDASVWYNSGSGWTLLVNTPATNNSGCGGQGFWTAYSYTLPASCNNNANVRIGFLWVNNDDGVGTDPSFAVDNITLSVAGGGSAPVAAFTPSATSVCVGQAVNFTDNSTNNPTSWTWTFPSGNPGTSSSQNPTGVIWNTPGNYTVSLLAANGSGNSTASVQIAVNAVPSVSATANPTTICVGQSTTLTGNGASSYTWQPGNLSGTSVTVSPTSTVTYTVTGTASGCTASGTVTVTVNTPPTVSINGLPSTFCTSSPPYPLSGTPANGTFSGPGVSGVTFTPSSAGVGTHTITYVATGGNGCTASTAQSVTVSNNPTVSISGLAATYCTSNGSVTMVGSPPGGTFAGPGVTGSTFSPSSAGAGTHTITYSYNSGGCSGNTTQQVTVSTGPTFSFSGLGSTYCVGASPATLSGSPTGGTFAGPGVSGSTFTASTAGIGTHTITYTYTDINGCTGSTSQTTIVTNSPNVTISGLNAVYCSTDPVDTLVGNPSGGTFSGNGMSGNVFSPSTAGAGTHLITYTYNVNGCAGSASQNVTVNAATQATLSGLDPTYCTTSPADTLQVSPPGGTIFGQGVIGNTFIPSSLSPGSYTITYSFTSGNGCVSNSSMSTTVFSSPTASLNLNVDTLCTTDPAVTLSGGSPSNGVYSGQGVSGGSFNPALTGPAPGSYTISYVVTDGNGCKGTATDVIYLEVCTGLDDALRAGIRMYPNPTSGTLKIEMPGDAELSLTDLNGRECLRTSVHAGSNTLDLTTLPQGMYLARIRTTSNEVVVKLMKGME